MLRQGLAQKNFGRDKDFRWRSHEILRIEGFTDAVFAFAVTLLVISLEVPKTYGELAEEMSGFIAFGIAFALLILIWYNQYRFFRRYGLQDTTTIVLNAILLFVVLFFIYPLKFLFTVLVRQVSGHGLAVHLRDGSVVPAIQTHEWQSLMTIYGLGYIAVFGVFALLYVHAYRKRESLALNELERFDTRASMRESVLNVSVALLSVLIVTIGGANLAGIAGLTYVLVGPLMTLHGVWNGKRRKSLER
jgi:uncharacterized membrane protein